MVDLLSPNISVIALNVNGLNASIKSQIGRRDLKNVTQIYAIKETHFKYDIGRFKVK